MAKYTEAQLVELHESAVIPTGFDFLEFTKSIEEQREQQQKLEGEESVGSRRRSSHHGTRPKFTFQRKPRVKPDAPQPDADGWVTLTKRKNSTGAEEGAVAKETIKETIKDQQINKIKTNSKKMAGAGGSDTRDIIADSAKSKFNAFAALEDDSDDSDEDED